MNDHYYQADLDQMFELELDQEEIEIAEDLAIQIMQIIEKYSINIQFLTLHNAQEILDELDKQIMSQNG